ncbi:nuclear transport factor 2 family protein [Pseudohalocynthiibacter aestuariivivens]|uniref:Nuclear transport factor 2 family protein n=1 Tax=Pseudohalocynthiibacter aestuariivivens TaxID=1591409 RepID=A0ABV5JJD5_9RHOB|nr:nuclear transport factor 2 family protein [Pseudohalocynthiibacter aestuariivivens]MBS9719024.1 nuclear transport factor 2 family protein [Pseudohalocynthiibacter aestuariivivens]
MANAKQLEDLKAGWAALADGDMDKLASFYADDMIFVLPGQNDILEGRTAFRAALDGIGQALPPGFDIKELRYCQGENEITNVVEFTADKLPNGSQCAVLFKFGNDGLITEERWFVDTEQWKAAF